MKLVSVHWVSWVYVLLVRPALDFGGEAVGFNDVYGKEERSGGPAYITRVLGGRDELSGYLYRYQSISININT